MSNSTALCGVCCLRHISKPSAVRCLDCDEGLCLDCKEHHSLLKATRNHNMISITEYQKLPQNVLEITQYCRNHEEIFQTFCKKHDCPCCRKCIIETHNNCKDLIEIEEYIKDFKSSARFNELEEMITENAENIRRISINRHENLTSLQEERQRIENDIVQTRIEINNHLDKLQVDLIQDLYVKELIERKKIQQVLKSLEEREGQLKESQTNFVNIKKYANDIQLFLSMKQIENSIVKDEAFVESLIENRSICQVGLDLKYTIDTEFLTVGIPSIGQVGVDYSTCQVRFTKKKDNQAQTMATKAIIKPIEHIALEFQKKITTCGGSVTGCTILPHGTIAFAKERDMNITVVKSDGLINFKIDLRPYQPFDITYIPNNNAIAVTSNCSKDINIVDVNTRGVLKTYCLDSPCAGISYSEQKIMLCSTEKGILELNQLDGSVKTIVSDTLHSHSHVALLGNKIYYTKSHNQSVICCDLQGNIQWTFKNPKMTCPFGVTVDTAGYVFVAGNSSNNVVVISQDGQQHKQLLSSMDGIGWPNCLIFDRDNNQLLVTNYTKGALLYNIK